MYARRFSLVFVTVLLLTAFGGMPARAAPTGFTGTIEWAGTWNEPVPPVITGGTLHMWPVAGFFVKTDNLDVNGLMIVDVKFVLPRGKQFPEGPMSGLWAIYPDYIIVDGLPVAVGQPAWEGTLTTTGTLNQEDQWNVTGQGLGPYSGQHISFKAYASLGTVQGRIVSH